jgi:hypothetical protein
MQSENNSIESTCVLILEKQEDSCLWHQNMQRENNSIELTHVLVVEKQDDSCLWHQKFGHLNYPTLYEYFSNGRITGLPKLAKHLKNCNDYLITKQG